MKFPDSYPDRIRQVFYTNPADVENRAGLVHWPKELPMPRPFSTIIYLGEEETIAIGYDDRGREYTDILKRSEFSGTNHWIPRNEDPQNSELFPHLNEDKNRNYLNDLKGPSDEELGRAA